MQKNVIFVVECFDENDETLERPVCTAPAAAGAPDALSRVVAHLSVHPMSAPQGQICKMVIITGMVSKSSSSLLQCVALYHTHLFFCSCAL